MQAETAAVRDIARKPGYFSGRQRVWHEQAQCSAGRKAGTTSAETARITELEREVRELRQADEILRKARAYFAQVALDRRFRK